MRQLACKPTVPLPGALTPSPGCTSIVSPASSSFANNLFSFPAVPHYCVAVSFKLEPTFVVLVDGRVIRSGAEENVKRSAVASPRIEC